MCFFDDQAKTVTAQLGSSDSSTVFNRHCIVDFIYFGLYKILLVGKKFYSLEDCKRHLKQFFAQNNKKFWEDGITKLPENAEIDYNAQ